MQFFYIISVVIHILAAAAWIGSGLFLAFIFFPLMRKPELKNQVLNILRQSGQRLRIFAWFAFLMLFLSGSFNVIHRYGIEAIATKGFWSSGTGFLLAIKLMLFLLIIIISFYHDFIVGPKAAALSEAKPDSTQVRKLRKRAAFCGVLNILLGVIIIILAVMIVRGL